MALPGLAAILEHEAAEEFSHAQQFIAKLQQRGVKFDYARLDATKLLPAGAVCTVDAQKEGELTKFIRAMLEKAIELETNVLENIEKIKTLADESKDNDVTLSSLF